VGVGILVFHRILVNQIADISDWMSSITVRNLESNLKDWLRLRAARLGRLMEEARVLLRTALAEKARRPTDLFEAIRRRIGSYEGWN
jgi:plasmid stability protein